MKTRSSYFAIILIAALVITFPLRASVTPGGETTIALDVEFGIRAIAPSRVTVPPTEHVTIRSNPAMADFTNYGWYKDGAPIPEAINPILIIDAAQLSDGGRYKYDSREAPTGRGSQTLLLNVRPATSLVNLSTRGFVGQGDQTMICGFIVTGKNDTSGFSTVLLRAVGPTLARFGVSGVLKEPKITIFSADGKPYTNDFDYLQMIGVPNTKEQHIQAATTKVGAFPLDPGAKDAVDIRPFPPGLYTVQITGVAASTGNVLLEAYEVSD